MKKRLFLFSCFAVVFAFLLLNTLSAVTEENTAKETELPPVISDLLSGKTTDLQGTLSNLEEPDFPLALTTCEVLQHKALHQDIKTSPEAVEAFKATLQKRLETSQTISFKQTKTCIQKIPAREILIEGKRLTIPEHYLAPLKFAITGFSPTGEAGTLLPDIQVSFAGGKAPVTAKILVDGKEIFANAVKNSFLFRPKLQADFILKIGTHKVTAVLSDSSNAVASASWSFMIGSKEGSVKEIPSDAKLVASFSTPVSKVCPDSPFKGMIQVVAYETSRGERIFKYVVFKNGSDTPVMTTTSLVQLRKLISGSVKMSIDFKPETRYAFVGNAIPLSYVLNGPPNEILSRQWKISDASGSTFFQTPTVDWVLRNPVEIELKLKVKELPDGPITDLSASKVIETIVPELSFDYPARSFFLTDTGTGSILLSGSRRIRIPYTGQRLELIEDKEIFYQGGPLFVTRSRWKKVETKNQGEIEKPLATETNLLFSEPGSIEVVHDIALKYTFIGNSGNETYEKEFSPLESGLYGVFPYSGNAVFKQIPSGVIFGTSRNAVLQSVDVEINAVKRHVTSQNGYFISFDPPITLAQSKLFPSSPLLQADTGYLVALSKLSTGLHQNPFENFTCPISYTKPEEAVNGEIALRLYFAAFQFNVKGLKDEPIPWPMFYQLFRPINNWFSIKAFTSPAELVQIEFEPQNPETEEGEKIDFKASIVPKPGLGEGKITADGGTLTLLDGYETQGVTEFGWSAILSPNQTPVAQGSTLNFSFEPKNGTGTYEISAATLLKAREKDTGGVVDVTGMGSTTVIVKPGFKITSPTASFSYPLGCTVSVDTSLKKEEWGKISWVLNEKPWQPGSVPPGHLTLEKPGKNTLKAVYNPSAGIEIIDEIVFFVRPVSLKIFPDRKVIPFVQGGTTYNLNLHAELNGNEVHELGKPIPWDDNGLRASIEKIEWSAVTRPNMQDAIAPDQTDSFGAVARFESPGALTALATVTIRISQTPVGKKQTVQTFSMSSTRADLWAVKPPFWGRINEKPPSEAFPKKVIAVSKRSFEVQNGNFIFEVDNYDWFQNFGLNKEIILKPARDDDQKLSAICKKINFVWEGPADQTGNDHLFTPLFQDPAAGVGVRLSTRLDFETAGEIQFEPVSLSVQVIPLADLVDVSIDPPTFSIPVTGTQKFRLVIKPRTKTSVPSKQLKENQIYLLDDSYVVTLNSVMWKADLAGKKREIVSPAFDFTPKDPGNYEINAFADVSVQEAINSPAPAIGNELSKKISGVVNPLSIEIRFNPREILPSRTTPTAPLSETSVTVRVSAGDIPIPNQQLTLSVVGALNSGGHDHENPESLRPLGSFQPLGGSTNPEGIFLATYTPEEFGGTDTIIVRSVQFPNVSVSRDIAVRVPGFECLPINNDEYIQIGGTLAHHGPNEHNFPAEPNDNHWGTLGLVHVIQELARDFNTDPIGGYNTLLHFNDMSLPYGGWFDINGFWNGDHDEHRLGRNVDLRINNLSDNQLIWLSPRIQRLFRRPPHPEVNPPHWHLRYFADVENPK